MENFEKKLIRDPETARAGAEAEKPLRDLARQEGVSEKDKAEIDKMARSRGEEAIMKLGKEAKPIENNDAFYEKIDLSKFSSRARSALGGILYDVGGTNWGSLSQLTKKEFASYMNVGKKTLKEVEDALAERGLRFGMRYKNSPWWSNKKRE